MESILSFFTDMHHLMKIRKMMSFTDMLLVSKLYIHTFYYMIYEIDKINKI